MKYLFYSFLCLIASGQLSSGAVVYTKPPEPIPILLTPLVGPTFFDINGDTTDELRFEWSQEQLLGFTAGSTRLISYESPATGNGAASIDEGSFIGVDAGTDQLWVEGRVILNSCFPGGCRGPFLNNDAYLGVEFQLTGNTHYGWINIRSSQQGFGHFLDWAYETEPGVPIAAGTIPEPSTWLLLPLSLALLASRRRKPPSP